MKKSLFILTGILLTLDLLSQSCLPDGIEFTSQAQIDSFQADYPGCTQIEGMVEINGDDITNLGGLIGITSVGFSLYISGNDNLNNLSALSSLESLGGSLLISSNPILTNLSGLENLASVSGDVFISSNAVLTDISAIGNIEAENVLELWITSNPLLATCDNPFVCDYLAGAYGTVNIKTNAPGCSNPPEIAEDCEITLPCLPNGDYNFFTQADIDAFHENYPGCTKLAGVVKVNGSDISNLDGLIGVDSIDGSLEVHNNPLLDALSGLDSLVWINGNITIVGNSLLTDISALSNLDTSAIIHLGINNNTQLSGCHIASFCDYLFGPYGTVHHAIVNNSGGCMSRDEVLMACTVGVDDFFEKEENSGETPFRISPNPASEKIIITTILPFAWYQLSIFDLTGQEVLKQSFAVPVITLDIAFLPKGMYFVVLEGAKTTATQKFVKAE